MQAQGQAQSQPPSQHFQTRINDLYQLAHQEDQLKLQLKAVGTKIKTVKDEILQEVKVSNLQSRSFAIGEKLIKYKMEKKTSGLSQKLLREALNKYYAQDPGQAQAVFDYVLSQRGIDFVEVIDVGKRPKPRQRRA